jgi:hypothetical protein
MRSSVQPSRRRSCRNSSSSNDSLLRRSSICSSVKPSRRYFCLISSRICSIFITIPVSNGGAIVRYSRSSASYSFADPVFRNYALSTFREQQHHFSFSLPDLDWANIVVKLVSRPRVNWVENSKDDAQIDLFSGKIDIERKPKQDG